MTMPPKHPHRTDKNLHPTGRRERRPGTGKTTLARELARGLGCPAVIRDGIEPGMAMAAPGYRAGGGDPLNRPTMGALSGVPRC